MLGLIHNLLEDFATERFGEPAWESVIDGAELSTPDAVYTSLGYYPDEDLLSLVRSAAKVSGIDEPTLVREFGAYSLPKLVERYPEFFEPHDNAKDFLMTVHDTIHVEVRKLYSEVRLPDILCEDPEPDLLIMIYRSPRALCKLAEGFIEGATAHYGQKATITHEKCKLKGADECRFEIRFS